LLEACRSATLTEINARRNSCVHAGFVPPSSGLDVMPADPVERQAIMRVSVLLQRLSDDTAPDHFTLKWLMSSMHQQSFGIMLLLMALDDRFHETYQLRVRRVTTTTPHPQALARLGEPRRMAAIPNVRPSFEAARGARVPLG
jgi:hypothetical protein